MKTKVVQDADVVTYVTVCDPGDEAVSALTEFARAGQLRVVQIAAGAFERAAVGWSE
jgi:uncharacterized protein